MKPRCKKIKYTRGRSNRPVLKTQKPVTPSICSNSFPTAPTVSSIWDEAHLDYNFGEAEYEIQDFQHPHKTPLEYLRCWVEKQRFIPQDLSDDFLVLFLMGAAYDVELAAERLQKYFESRRVPSFLSRNRDPLSCENLEIFDKVYVLPMPEATDDGRKIILTGLVKPTIHYKQEEHAKALAMVFDLLIWEKDFGFGDFEIVLDGRGFDCPQLLENKFYNHRTITSFLLDTMPGTLRSFYLLYPPPYIAKVADNRNRIWITVVKTKQDMICYLPADILPLEFGGNLGHLEDLIEQWKVHMIQCRSFFINFEKKMRNDFKREICYEKEVKERGKNWVQEMKLEADEWEYKIQYYKKMKDYIPFKHPGFGSQRNLLKPKKQPQIDPLKKCREKAKEEEEAAKTFQPTWLYVGYAKEIRKARLQAEMEKLKQCRVFSPVRELNVLLF